MDRINRQINDKARGAYNMDEILRNGNPRYTQSGPAYDSSDIRRADRKREKAARKLTRGSNKGQKTSTGRKSW